jgi:hypothetical protein
VLDALQGAAHDQEKMAELEANKPTDEELEAKAEKLGERILNTMAKCIT